MTCHDFHCRCHSSGVLDVSSTAFSTYQTLKSLSRQAVPLLSNGLPETPNRPSHSSKDWVRIQLSFISWCNWCTNHWSFSSRIPCLLAGTLAWFPHAGPQKGFSWQLQHYGIVRVFGQECDIWNIQVSQSFHLHAYFGNDAEVSSGSHGHQLVVRGLRRGCWPQPIGDGSSSHWFSLVFSPSTHNLIPCAHNCANWSRGYLGSQIAQRGLWVRRCSTMQSWSDFMIGCRCQRIAHSVFHPTHHRWNAKMVWWYNILCTWANWENIS